jgi:hypothetical protein
MVPAEQTMLQAKVSCLTPKDELGPAFRRLSKISDQPVRDKDELKYAYHHKDEKAFGSFVPSFLRALLIVLRTLRAISTLRNMEAECPFAGRW